MTSLSEAWIVVVTRFIVFPWVRLRNFGCRIGFVSNLNLCWKKCSQLVDTGCVCVALIAGSIPSVWNGMINEKIFSQISQPSLKEELPNAASSISLSIARGLVIWGIILIKFITCDDLLVQSLQLHLILWRLISIIVEYRKVDGVQRWRWVSVCNELQTTAFSKLLMTSIIFTW